MRQDTYKNLGVDPRARLARLRGDKAPPVNVLGKAIGRVLKSADGQMLLDYMLLHSYGAVAPREASDSALREIEVRKRFLDQILAVAEEPSATPQSPATPASPLP